MGCGGAVPHSSGSQKPDHAPWTKLLKAHVTAEGMVDYEGMRADSPALQRYLDALAAHPPDTAAWSDHEQMAYWINAYNAYTVALILDHWPVESIKDIGPAIQIPFVLSPWDIKFIKIGGNEMDLNHIEHGILRKQFDDPRIHFAVNCASISCPPLRREAYTGAQLDEQLREQTVSFINNPSYNKISTDEVEISKLFSWYQGDFTTRGSLIDFLKEYSKKPINNEAEVNYMTYDWSLNAAGK
jgi:hypothetical protein